MSAHVLLVEDNRDFIANLREILEDIGHQVRSAESCAEAMKVGKGWVEVALVDLKLPDGDGTTLAAQLKDDNPDCEVVLLTGHASVESAAAAVRAGLWAYLMKPLSTPDLLATLDKAVRHVKTQLEKRELTRRAQMAEKLAAVGTLTAGLSHEIRNPLNAAALQLTVLERRILKLTPELQQVLLGPLTLVRDEIRRLEHILQDFLQFAGGHTVRPELVSVNVWLSELLDFFEPNLTENGIRLTRRLATKLPAVLVDRELMKQAVFNLLTNARQAMPRGGELTVRTWSSGDRVRIDVTDTGEGIDPDVLPRIWEVYFSTKEHGTGLGLPTVRRIVAEHGGEVTVQSRPRRGTTFSVFLPVPPTISAAETLRLPGARAAGGDDLTTVLAPARGSEERTQ
jgi:two-component system, NtrC family, sensor histidine kinase HydH